MADVNGDAEEAGEGARSMRLERVNGFSDAVLAVAITLLILTIEVPAVSGAGGPGAELGGLWPVLPGHDCPLYSADHKMSRSFPGQASMVE